MKKLPERVVNILLILFGILGILSFLVPALGDITAWGFFARLHDIFLQISIADSHGMLYN